METSIIERARAFALARHSGQTRKDVPETPCWKHLEEVASRVAGSGGDEGGVAAAWFHDTVEDCPPTSLAEIGAAFGPRFSAIVAEAADDKNLDTAERKQLRVATAGTRSPEAASVKPCDKMSNVGSVGETPPCDWSQARRSACLHRAEAVVSRLDLADAPRAGFRAVPDCARAHVLSR